MPSTSFACSSPGAALLLRPLPHDTTAGELCASPAPPTSIWHLGNDDEGRYWARPPQHGCRHRRGSRPQLLASLSSCCSPTVSVQQQQSPLRLLAAGPTILPPPVRRRAPAPPPPEPQPQQEQPEQQGQQEHEHTQQRAASSKSSWWQLLIAGAMSAVVSRTAVAPLERVKMELMLKQGAGTAGPTAAQILRTEGLPGFWKGNALNLLRTAPFKATNFASFELLHRALVGMTGRADGNLERFTAGALAGVTATVVCFPLDVVRTRLMSRARGPSYGPGPFQTLAGILRYEGVAALYTGCLPAVLGMMPAGAVFYGVYDWLKTRHLAQEPGGLGCYQTTPVAELQLPAAYTLLYGALAGAASEVIIYPLEVVRRRMQMQQLVAAAAAHHHHRHNHLLSHTGGRVVAVAGGGAGGIAGVGRVVATCSAILRAEGLAGFYTGLAPNMLQVLPSAALSYATFDGVKRLLLVAGTGRNSGGGSGG